MWKLQPLFPARFLLTNNSCRRNLTMTTGQTACARWARGFIEYADRLSRWTRRKWKYSQGIKEKINLMIRFGNADINSGANELVKKFTYIFVMKTKMQHHENRRFSERKMVVQRGLYICPTL